MADAIGFWNAALFAIARGLSSVFGNSARLVKYYFVSQPVRPLPLKVGTGKFSIDWATADSGLFAQLDRPSTTIASRFAQNARCLVATIGEGRLAGCLWFVVGPYREDEVSALFVPSPASSTAWDFDVAILPDYRMSRLFGYLWGRATEELSALGVSHTCSRISAFNAASMASHRRLGAVVRGSATFLCLGRMQVMVATLRPWIHVSWNPRSRPVVVVPA